MAELASKNKLGLEHLLLPSPKSHPPIIQSCEVMLSSSLEANFQEESLTNLPKVLSYHHFFNLTEVLSAINRPPSRTSTLDPYLNETR